MIEKTKRVCESYYDDSIDEIDNKNEWNWLIADWF